MMFCHALVPLRCPFVRCRKNFYWRKNTKGPTSTSKTLKLTNLLKKQPCFRPLCLFCLFLCKVPVLKPVLIGRVNKSRVVLHQFSHSSIKGLLWRKAKKSPTQHQRRWTLQNLLKKRPCFYIPIFVFFVPPQSSCAKAGVDWSCEWK